MGPGRNTDSETLYPGRDPSRHQNLIDSFHGHAPLLQKFYQKCNKFLDPDRDPNRHQNISK